MRSILLVVSLVLLVAGFSWRSHSRRVAEAKVAAEQLAVWTGAKRGDVEAEAKLGALYMRGRGVPQDYAAGLAWYRKAAGQGSATAEVGLAAAYYYAAGVSADYAEAFRWYKKAADQGNSQGESGLAYLYQHGDGVTRDYDAALRWYRKAADNGSAAAEYRIGYMYYYGEGVPSDRAEANRWFAKAAAAGYVDAQRVLGPGFSTVMKVSLLVELVGGLFLLSFAPVRLNHLEGTAVGWDRNRRATVAVGLLTIFYVGVEWYGYASFHLRRIGVPLNAFTFLRWVVSFLLAAAFVYMVRVAWSKRTVDPAGSAQVQESNARPRDSSQ
ncbi:MAG TPA: tetratricopeptide repeat protein [Acidobacteriaceae bacterium]|jgi:hypothetical protein|nr:tetratricopeptide repeat protein [Acidobacteriaceae bacterium]